VGSLSKEKGFESNAEAAKTLWDWTEHELVKRGY